MYENKEKYRKNKEKSTKRRTGMEAYFKGTLLYDKDLQRIGTKKEIKIDGKEEKKSLQFRLDPLE